MKKKDKQLAIRVLLESYKVELRDKTTYLFNNLSKDSKIKREEVAEILINFWSRGKNFWLFNHTCVACQDDDEHCWKCDEIMRDSKNSNSNKNQTPFMEWLYNNKENMSTRLFNVFNQYNSDYWKLRGWEGVPFTFLEEVNMEDFLKLRNAGVQSWKEFFLLRGY